jgi:calcineurin-like phosphoesterase family protein
MNKTIVENWNRVVEKDDTVFHLGDFSFTLLSMM